MDAAEDIASETFLTATQVWGIEGIPERPAAWLYHVAKNKAVNYLHRNAVFDQKISPDLAHTSSLSVEPEIDLSPANISDSQLRMMFAICHPSISREAQIGLSLRILCGFGIGEIADAFLTSKETINKRLFRAKEKLREEKIDVELPVEADMEPRLSSVLTTIYLLFNEGYYSISQNQTLRKELCLEAIRLCLILAESGYSDKPRVNALLSLMCFHLSRFDARQDKSGALILYEDQDTGLWNQDWIRKGGYFLNRASQGADLSRYHLEAGIAYWHTVREDSATKWENILQLYDRLLELEYTPVAALNRIYVLSKTEGKQVAITEALALHLSGNHFYYTLLGELYSGSEPQKAHHYYTLALELVKTDNDRNAIRHKIDKLKFT